MISGAQLALVRSRDRDRFDARLALLEELGRSADPSAVPVLVELLLDPALRPGPLGTTLSVKRSAGRALEELGAIAVPGMVDALRSAPGAPLGPALISVLREMTCPEAEDALIAVLGDPASTPPMRWMAAGHLGLRGVVRALDALVALLGDPDPDVRRTALWSIGRVPVEDRERVRVLVRPHLADPVTADRAAVALGRLGDAAVADRLLEILAHAEDDPDSTDAAEAAGGLAGIGAAVVPALCALLDAEIAHEQDVARALREIGDPRSDGALGRFRRRLDA